MYLAKSDGTLLSDHLLLTSYIGILLLNKLGVSLETNIAKKAITLCLLHDIGKCTDHFQNITLKSKITLSDIDQTQSNEVTILESQEREKKQVYFPRHNEISTLYLYKVITFLQKTDEYESLLSSIYWHHATFDSFNNLKEKTYEILINAIEKSDNIDVPYENVLEKISHYLNDFKELYNFKIIQNCIDSTILNCDIKDYKFDRGRKRENIPSLFIDGKDLDYFELLKINKECLFLHMIVTAADRTASSFSKDKVEEILSKINSYNDILTCSILLDKFENLSEFNVLNIIPPKKYENARFENQRKVVIEASSHRTSQINAPAGFGKTILGLLWALQVKKSTIVWVCPRNFVAEGNYNELVSKIKEFNLEEDVGVELFLGSQQIRCTENCLNKKFVITVTNIDNFLSPMVNSASTNRLLKWSTATVIFDEFHELTSNKRLFAGFNLIMNVRHGVCSKVKTLLLSATPGVISELFENHHDDSNFENVAYFPKKFGHCFAQHQEKYEFIIGENDFDNVINNDTLTMFNSIKNCQNHHLLQREVLNRSQDVLLHSKFLSSAKNTKLNDLFNKFGENNSSTKEESWTMSPIGQASLNFSFSTLRKSCESPESELQILGRINRFGYINGVCKITINAMYSNKSEECAIKSRYDLDLSKVWFEFLKQNFNNQILKLDECYERYNEFCKANEFKLIDYYKKLFNDGINGEFSNKCSSLKIQHGIVDLYPRERFIKTKNSNNDVMYSTRSIRSDVGAFVIYKDKNDIWLKETFNVINPDILNSKTISNIKDVQNCGLFQYPEIDRKQFKDDKKNRSWLLNMARCNETPLPLDTYIYSQEYGLQLQQQFESEEDLTEE